MRIYMMLHWILMQPADHDAILEIGFGNGKLFDKIFARAKNCG